jgi:hypothetical protein
MDVRSYALNLVLNLISLGGRLHVFVIASIFLHSFIFVFVKK